MRQLFPTDETINNPERAYDRLDLAASTEPGPYVYINMVCSLDGRVQLNGRAAGIGSRIDQRLLLGLRSQADCILNGAATVQAEESFTVIPDELVALRVARGQQPQPLWAFATASGDVKMESRLFREATPRPIAFVAQGTPLAKQETLAQSTTVVVAGVDRPEGSSRMGDRLLRGLLNEMGKNLDRVHGVRGLGVRALYLQICRRRPQKRRGDNRFRQGNQHLSQRP